MDKIDKFALLALLAAGVGGLIYWRTHKGGVPMVNSPAVASLPAVRETAAPTQRPTIAPSVGAKVEQGAQNIGALVQTASQAIQTGIGVVNQLGGFAKSLGINF